MRRLSAHGNASRWMAGRYTKDEPSQERPKMAGPNPGAASRRGIHCIGDCYSRGSTPGCCPWFPPSFDGTVCVRAGRLSRRFRNSWRKEIRSSHFVGHGDYSPSRGCPGAFTTISAQLDCRRPGRCSRSTRFAGPRTALVRTKSTGIPVILRPAQESATLHSSPTWSRQRTAST